MRTKKDRIIEMLREDDEMDIFTAVENAEELDIDLKFKISSYEEMLDEITDCIDREQLVKARDILVTMCPLDWKWGDGIADYWWYENDSNTYLPIRDVKDLINILEEYY